MQGSHTFKQHGRMKSKMELLRSALNTIKHLYKLLLKQTPGNAPNLTSPLGEAAGCSSMSVLSFLPGGKIKKRNIPQRTQAAYVQGAVKVSLRQ